MQNNTDKGNSKLLLSNSNVKSMSVRSDSSVTTEPLVAKMNTMTGDFLIETDYCESFENKRQALADMVEDGDGFTKEEIHDLVLTANKAVWQESRDA